uniref:Small ribosomal subunit protein uS10 domain-containing protein n=1 Tax=Marmota marmota marmota TaxID=9994 RepID=A0A8C5ZNC0_MARMA
MAFKNTGKTPLQPEVASQRTRITLTTCNVKLLEKVCAHFIRGTKEKNLKMKASVCTPTKIKKGCKKCLVVCSKSWDHFHMRILK